MVFISNVSLKRFSGRLLMNTNQNKIREMQVAATQAAIKLALASVSVEAVFSTRLATVLKNGDTRTVDVLLGKSEAELLKLKGFGKGMLRDVSEYLEQVGVARPPYYDEFPWLAIRHGLEQAGYTEGAIGLFREMFWKSGIAPVRQRKEN